MSDKVIVEAFINMDVDGLGPNKDSDLWQLSIEESVDQVQGVIHSLYSIILNNPKFRDSQGVTDVEGILVGNLVEILLHNITGLNHDDLWAYARAFNDGLAVILRETV